LSLSVLLLRVAKEKKAESFTPVRAKRDYSKLDRGERKARRRAAPGAEGGNSCLICAFQHREKEGQEDEAVKERGGKGRRKKGVRTPNEGRASGFVVSHVSTRTTLVTILKKKKKTGRGEISRIAPGGHSLREK